MSLDPSGVSVAFQRGDQRARLEAGRQTAESEGRDLAPFGKEKWILPRPG